MSAEPLPAPPPPVPPWPTGPDGLYTIDDYDLIPEDDGHRYELIDGRLDVVPGPMPRHNLVVYELCRALDDVLPAGYRTNYDVDIRFPDRTQCLAPDVLVTTLERAAGEERVPAEDVLLVVEVVSPGSWRIDRRVKPEIYAAAGIAAFWRVDLGPLTVVEHHLVDGAYVPVQALTTGDLVVERPFPMRVDLDPLRTLLA